jgi:hypothetical protein
MKSKRSEKTNIKVKIDTNEFSNQTAAETFFEVIEFISKKVGIEKFLEDNEKITSPYKFIDISEDSFPNYSSGSIRLSSSGKFYISTHCPTRDKSKVISDLLDKYEIDGSVELIDSSNSILDTSTKLLKPKLDFRHFWDKLVPELSKVTDTIKSSRKSSQSWLSGSTGIRDFHVNCVINSKKCRIEFYLGREKEDNKKVFDFLLNKRNEIESSLNHILDFDRLSDKKCSNISFKLPDFDSKNEEDIINFFVVNFPKFERTFSNYFEEIRILLNDNSIDTEISENINYENEFSLNTNQTRVINPFGAKRDSSSICVTGESGNGKSYRVEKTLTYNNHKFIFETLDPTSTGILTQYQSGTYLRNNVGDFIIGAQQDPTNYYTVVLDECHKDGFIDRINAELLQCLSSKRNDGLRYFQTNKITDNLFSELELRNGRRIIPDNLGFILITSKPDIIHYNDDIKNRVDVINLKLEDRDEDFTIENLIKKEEVVTEDKFGNKD